MSGGSVHGPDQSMRSTALYSFVAPAEIADAVARLPALT